MRRENRGMRLELAAARSELQRMQTFLGTKGARELKTWDLFAELERSTAAASELQAQRARDAVRAAESQRSAEVLAAQLAAAKKQAQRAQDEVRNRFV